MGEIPAALHPDSDPTLTLPRAGTGNLRPSVEGSSLSAGVVQECSQSVAKGGRIENVEELALVILGSTDEEVDRALERMRLNFYQLWIVVEELRTSTDPNGLLREWRESPKGSIGWRKALSYEEALEVLRVSLSRRP